MAAAPTLDRTLAWLKRQIAHRGLHDAKAGIIENSATAVDAAIAADYAIEVDLQPARDFQPVVFHDATLDRLTGEQGRLCDRNSEALCAIALTGSAKADHIMSLPELLDRVHGRVPLVLEIKSPKSRPDPDHRYVRNITAALSRYAGPVAVMSFDASLLAAFRRLAPNLPRGLVAQGPEKSASSLLQCHVLPQLAAAAIARPHFIAYDIHSLPALMPALARRFFKLPLLTWTVRSEADRQKAAHLADAAIFETLRP